MAGKEKVKCPVCNNTEYIVNTINGHSCCTYCDGEFCFGCGKHPVELLGNAGVCIECMKKRTAVQAFGSATTSFGVVVTKKEVEAAIEMMHIREAEGNLSEDEQILIMELELGGHYKSRIKETK